MYVAKINNDLYLKKAFEQDDWNGSQLIRYKLSNSLREAKLFECIDEGEPFIDNLKLYGFDFYNLEEIKDN